MHIVDDPELEQAETAWLGGGSAVPVVRIYIARGDADTAAVIARLALGRPNCKDVEELEALLDQIDDAPPDWDETLREFSRQPSVERWRELVRFVPPEQIYQRLRNAIRRLRKLDTDPNVLFLCACDLGMTPDAIALVEEGLVDTNVIERRAESAGGAKTTYLGLAATAAFLAKDLVGAIRLLRESAAHENDLCTPFPHVHFIRENATDEENALLDQAGIPRVSE